MIKIWTCLTFAMFATIKLHLPWPYRYTVYDFTTPPESSKACGYHIQYLDMFPEPLFLSLFFPTLIPTYINACWYALPHPPLMLHLKLKYPITNKQWNAMDSWFETYIRICIFRTTTNCALQSSLGQIEPYCVLRCVNTCNAHELDRTHRLPSFILTKSFARDLLYTPRAFPLLAFWCVL